VLFPAYSVPPWPWCRRRLYVFGSSVRAAVRPCVRDSRGSFMFPRYLQYLLMDFRQTFVTGASWDTDDLITFLGQKVNVQGHTIAAEAHSTRRYRRVQLFLAYFVPPWPWLLTFWPQTVKLSFLTHNTLLSWAGTFVSGAKLLKQPKWRRAVLQKSVVSAVSVLEQERL